MMARIEVTEGTPEWHAIRLDHIGGSEISALMLPPSELPGFHISAWTLRQVKSRKCPAEQSVDEPGSLPRLGRLLEPAIASELAAMEGWGLIKGAYEACDDVPGMGASIDYLIEPGPKELEMGWTGTGVLQVKYSLGATHRLRWTDGEPPLYVLYQLQHEMRCKGASWGAVGCLVDGALKVYRSKAHDATQANIVGMVREFWRALETDTPIFAPNGRRVDIVDGSASTSDTIAAMWPVPPLEDLLDLTGDNEAADIAFDVLTYRASRMQAEKAEDKTGNRQCQRDWNARQQQDEKRHQH